MNQKRFIIRGTLLLTFVGILSRITGFAYKIFLSRTIGASEIGLFQMAMPVFAFCSTLSGGGVQTAISHFTAECHARGDRRGAKRILFAGLLLSVFLSLICSVILYLNAALIAERFLLEELCTGLLKILAFSLPFCMIHGCILGYFVGIKRIAPSALAQFIEQISRVSCALLIYALAQKAGRAPDVKIMVFGQLAGEAASALYCVLCFGISETRRSKARGFSQIQELPGELAAALGRLLSVSLPLGLNRALMCILQAMEAALLPQMLQRSGLSSAESLSAYGTFTGMAMPMILFPTAITSAVGSLLLPVISEAHALHRQKQISDTVNASFLGSLFLGSFFLGAFALFGTDIGIAVFHSQAAGIYLVQLSLICPLIYINTTMLSILHGLGRAASLLIWQLAGVSLRLVCIIKLVPLYGMPGYLCGMFSDQLLLSAFVLLSLHRYGALTVPISESFTRILLPVIAGGGAAWMFLAALAEKIPALAKLFLGGVIYCMGFLIISLFCTLSRPLRDTLLHNLLRKKPS